MYNYIKTLQNIVTRRRYRKILTFSAPHVFKALQILSRQKYVSRVTFCSELYLGEGSVKTLILHLKEDGLVESIRAGSFLTPKGKQFLKKFLEVIPAQCFINSCYIARGKYNFAILLKNYANKIGNGMQQRDYAILYGASGAITLAYKKNEFIFPREQIDCLSNDTKTKDTLISNLHPEDDDIVIIASAGERFIAEISAINSVLWTLATHEKH